MTKEEAKLALEDKGLKMSHKSFRKDDWMMKVFDNYVFDNEFEQPIALYWADKIDSTWDNDWFIYDSEEYRNYFDMRFSPIKEEKNIKQLFFNFVTKLHEFFKSLIFLIVFVYVILFLIFGGEFHFSINWDLIKNLFK